MPTLVLSPTTETFSLSLINDIRIDTLSWKPERNLTETLLPQIDSLLKKHALNTKNLSRIVTCTGPGSYTSLRITLSILNTFAYVYAIPIIGLSLFDIELFSFLQQIPHAPIPLHGTQHISITLSSKYKDKITQSYQCTFENKLIKNIEKITTHPPETTPYSFPLSFHEGKGKSSWDTQYTTTSVSQHETTLQIAQAFRENEGITKYIKPQTMVTPLYYRAPVTTISKKKTISTL